ncbi:biotin--[acetyl-CoA-carboxylase] ligase [Roseiconus lacunae]|uniref:biotin--[acetyl-CoA-carboxylase] ligase n=1 Tax=Roseiconus lacunae TaxID=2605694 RepID=UPI001E4134E4|nr:biotin--[acetyl-CoA-carboxylase] ligase [Roseiconus lacunae]MCD0461440.1 biotin--[acetyl-CoA-carboxylase] ligase [Roseiconus lacunae]
MNDLLDCHGNVTDGMRLAVSSLITDGVIGSATYHAETSSTNSDALQSIQASPTDGLPSDHLPRLFLTDRQTAGRGRQGNQWNSSEDSLTFSLLVKFDSHSPHADLTSVACGVAVSQGIEYCCAPIRVGLKWPNDLCVVRDGQRRMIEKLGGILIESSAAAPHRLIIGIGINVANRPQLTNGHSTPAIALYDVVERRVSREDLLQSIVQSVTESLRALSTSGKEVVKAYRSRCVLSGRPITLRQNDSLIEGLCQGIADDGSLQITGAHGQTQLLRSGQVHQVRLG